MEKKLLITAVCGLISRVNKNPMHFIKCVIEETTSGTPPFINTSKQLHDIKLVFEGK